MDQVSNYVLPIYYLYRATSSSAILSLTFQCSLDASNNTFCFFIITEKLDEEKKEREHLLALNQVIAQQVLQKRRSLPGKISTIDFKTMHEAAHPSGRITNYKL